MSRETLLNRRRVVAIGTSLVAFAALVGLGVADARNDDGSKTFFLQAFPSESPVVRPQPRADAARSARALTVSRLQGRWAEPPRFARVALRTHPKTRLAVGAPLIKPLAGKVTLLTDATLVRGDAVMTVGGIRIFDGGAVFPHRDTDFVMLGGAAGLSRAVTRTLLAMDARPRG